MNNPSLSTIQEEDYSIEWGDNVIQGYPYTYSGTFYNDGDFTDAFTTAEIQFEYIEDSSVTYEHAITDYENHEQKYPKDISNITLYENTTVENPTKMDANDNDYTYFDRDGYGFYNASYSFTDDLVGSNPLGWTISETGGTVGIIYEEEGHKKVVELYDDDGVNKVELEQSLNDITSGNIDMWWLTTDATLQSYFRLEDGGSTDALTLEIDEDKFQYYDTAWNDIQSAYDNTWYHLRIEFDLNSSWNIYIDGVRYGSYAYRGTPTAIDKIYFSTSATDSSYYFYIDSIGYSWLSNYTIGENNHSVYSIEDYPATYSFTNDSLGSVPNGWTNSSGNNCFVPIVDYLDGHHKIINLNDEDTSDEAKISNEFSSQINGSIEFWIRTTSNSKRSTIIIDKSSALSNIGIVMRENGQWAYFTNPWVLNDLGSYNANQWYHVRINFDCGTDTFDLYIDGDLIGNDLLFRVSTVSLEYLRFISRGVDSEYSTYIDAIGFDWLSNYTIGNNRYLDKYITINTIITIPLEYYNRDLLQLSIDSRYYVSNSLYINWSIYDNSINSWEQITYSLDITETLHEFDKTTDITNYINSTGYLKLKYYGSINSSEYLLVDQLILDLYFKTVISYEKTLDLLGTWKYRFVLDEGLGSEHITDYIYFNVIIQSANFEGISESKYATRWVLTSTDTSGYTTVVYSDYLTGGDWTLSDYSQSRFTIKTTELSNYLSDDWYLSSSLWDYTSTSYTLSELFTGAYSICYYNGYWYAMDGYNHEVYQYTTSWSYTSNYWSIGTQSSGCFDIWNYGGNWYVADIVDHDIDKYNSNWVYQTSYTVSSQMNYPYSICNKDGYWYVLAQDDDDVYKYTSTFSYTGSSYDLSSQDGDPRDIFFQSNENRWWMLGDNSNDVFKYSSSWVYQTSSYDLGTENTDVRDIHYYNGYWWMLGQSGSDGKVYRYENYLSVAKFYDYTGGEGYAYMQTDTTETLGLLSSQYSSSISLISGDYFIIDLQTTSDNALLKLYKGGVLQKTLTVLTANTETSRQQVEVYVDEDVEFDQVKISSELTDTEYLKLYSIKADHWTFESEQDQTSMYVEPFGQNDIVVNYGNNSLKIYENDILQVETYITIGFELTTYVFESTLPETVFVSFYDSNNEYLDFNQFKVYVNYTLYEKAFENQRLTNREFFVDEDSSIEFDVYDSFDVSIYSASRLAKTFMDITLNVYSLKLKNESTKLVNYTIEKDASSVIKSGNIFPEEIVEYHISSGNYHLNYTNHEDDSFHSYNFILSQNQIITINSTYFDVYFALFTYDGLGISHDIIRFYINRVRKDLGFNTLKQDTNNIKVLDYFNQSLFNQNVNLRQYSEYNIFIEIYTMIIFNNYSHPIKLKIERNNIEFEQIIESQFGMPYRMLPNVEYKLEIYYLNGTLIEEKEIELDSNNKIVSFGFYKEEVPYNPDNLVNSYNNIIVLIVLLTGIILIVLGVVLYLKKKNQELKEKRRNSRLEHQLSPDSHTHNLGSRRY